MIRNFQRAWRAAFGKRLCRAERKARAALGVPLAYPELLTARQRKATAAEFARWDDELRRDGLDTHRIIQKHRRGTP